jgi:hypothetical protein
MEQEILQFIGNYGILGLLAYFSIKEFFNWLGKGNEKSKKDDKNERLIKVETLFTEHCKVQGESFATVHNGLNSNANAIKDISNALQKNTEAIAVLTTMINERIPKIGA